MANKRLQPVKKAKKGILSVIFSRVFVLSALIIIQLLVFASTITYLKDYATYIYAFFLVMGIVIIIYIINDKSNTDFKMTWILLIMAVPIVGAAFYAFLKSQPGTKAIEKRISELKKETDSYMMQDAQVLDEIRKSKPANANLVTYLNNQMSYPIYRNSPVTYFPSGEEKFEALKTRLKQAEEYIFLEYFIIEKGVMWNEILDILKEKVWQGVDVRVLYDGMCSLQALPYHYDKELKRAGIKCKQFSPIRPVVSSYQNNRDH